MSLPSWWIEPQVSQASLAWFGVMLLALTALATLCSPHRRRRLGTLKFVLAHASLVAVPLAGVLVVRSGYRHAYLEAGEGFWGAMWLSLLWMVAFIAIGSLIVKRLPPVRELRRAGREIWMGRLRRAFGMGS